MDSVEILAEVAAYKDLEVEEYVDHLRVGKGGWYYRIQGGPTMSMQLVADLALPILLVKERYKVPGVRIYVSEN